MRELRVHQLPEHVPPGELVGRTAVVVDLLRATTSIVYALGAGAEAVIPCLTIEDTREIAAGLPRGRAVLAGERGGLPIEGFDLGNSPSEFTPETVGGKVVIMTTTNGTRALLHCRRADKILVAALANLSAVRTAVSTCQRVDIVCAGTDGQPTEEDLFAAGAIAQGLSLRWMMDEPPAVSRRLWKRLTERFSGDELTARIVAAISDSRGARNLQQIGFERDIEIAARVDVFAIVPTYDPVTGRVVLER
jgi:2-phosphosulfolactate phosphatase